MAFAFPTAKRLVVFCLAGSVLSLGPVAAAETARLFGYTGEGVIEDNSGNPFLRGYRLALPGFTLDHVVEASYRLGKLPDRGPGVADVYFAFELVDREELKKYYQSRLSRSAAEASRRQEMDWPQSVELRIETADGKQVYAESLIVGSSIWSLAYRRETKRYEVNCYSRTRLLQPPNAFQPFKIQQGESYILRVRYDPRSKPVNLKAFVRLYSGGGT